MSEYLYVVEFKDNLEQKRVEVRASSPVKAFQKVCPNYACIPTYGNKRLGTVHITNISAKRPTEVWYGIKPRTKNKGGM